MNIELTPVEARVIGCLIEKQITTPDQYPLSRNALVNACNQKSNRDPVMELDDGTVQRTLDGLSKKHFVMEKSGFGSRVPKYQHRFCNTEFGQLKLDSQELAVVCELLLRGPQTPGELRSRASRMAACSDVSETEATLRKLMERADGPFVTRLAREPGRRESRYAQLFCGPVEGSVHAQETAAPIDGPRPVADQLARGQQSPPGQQGMPVPAPELSFPASRNDERLARVEEELRELRAELDDLKRRLGG